MQNLKTVDFGVAFTLTRPAPADYEDKDGNTQTAAANEPRFNYSNGVAQGLMLDASLSETAAIDDVPLFNSSAGHWIIDATFDDSEPLKGMGLDERFEGSGKMVVSYSGGTAKVWAGGQAIYTVASYTPAEPTHICEGGMATIGSLVYKPSVISDADASALATGDFQVAPFAPDELFANGEQGAWYDPSDLATLFQDAAGTIPVTADGDPVGLMLDKSSNGNHAVQNTTASKPTYHTDGTLHWLHFDGSGDFIASEDYEPVVFQPNSLSVAFRHIGGIRIIGRKGAAGSGQLVQNSSGTLAWYAGSVAGDKSILSGTDYVVSGVFDGAASKYSLNGDAYSALDAGTNSTTGPVIGADDGGASPSEMLFYGLISVEGDFSEKAGDVSKYLAGKAGVTLP